MAATRTFLAQRCVPGVLSVSGTVVSFVPDTEDSMESHLSVADLEDTEIDSTTKHLKLRTPTGALELSVDGGGEKALESVFKQQYTHIQQNFVDPRAGATTARMAGAAFLLAGDTPERSLDGIERNASSKRSRRTSVRTSTTKLDSSDTVFLPNSGRREVWDVMLALVIVYSCVVVPFRIGFDLPARGVWEILDLCVDGLFLIDICISFNTAFCPDLAKPQILEFDRWEIAKNYFKTWFFIDLASTIPFDFIMDKFDSDQGSQQDTALRFVKMIRLFKLVRLVKLGKFLTKLEEEGHLSCAARQMIQLLLIVTLLGHYMACLWWWISIPYMASGQSWANAYDGDISGNTSWTPYVCCLYWAFVTMTTLGYGDITPANEAEIAFSIFAQCIGVIVFAFIIGQMTSISERSNAEANERKRQRDAIKAYMKGKDLPDEMQRRIRLLFNHRMQSQSIYNESEILQLLPSSVRAELRRETSKSLLGHFELFANSSDAFIDQILTVIIDTDYSPGDKIFGSGSQAEHSYFLVSGQIELISKSKCVIERDGAVVGVAALLGAIIERELFHHETATAITVTQGFRLAAQDMGNVLDQFPAVRNELKHQEIGTHADAANTLRNAALRVAAVNATSALRGKAGPSTVVPAGLAATAEDGKKNPVTPSSLAHHHSMLGTVHHDDAETFDKKKDCVLQCLPTIHPANKVLWQRAEMWDLLLCILIIYSCITVPLVTCFSIEPTLASVVVDYFVDCLFGLDILKSFLTAVKIDEQYVTDKDVIAYQYIKGWFAVDFLSTFPFQAFSSSLLFFKILRMLKLARLVKLQKFLTRFEEEDKINPGALRMMQLFFSIIFLAHLIACCWYYVGSLGAHNAGASDLDDNWIYHTDDRLNTPNSTLEMRYLYSLYWSFTCLTTVGYGDILPQNDTERIFNIFIMLIGALVFGNVVGSITSVASSLFDPNPILDNLNSYMAFRNVPKGLRRQVRAAAKETMAKSLAFDESAIFGQGQLSSPLVSEVTRYLMRDMIQVLPFLAGADVFFLQGMASILQPVSHEMNKTFVREGQVTDACYYLMDGEILLSNQTGHLEEISFSPDSLEDAKAPIRFVGEAALDFESNLVNSPITVKCVANSRFYCLSGRELKALASRSALMTSQVQKFKLSHKLYHKAMLTEQGEDERLSLVEEFRANNAMKFWKKKLGSSSLVSQKMA